MVAEPDVARVWFPHENAPGLAMSRSLGDAMVKRYGVSAEPQIVHKEICCDDEYVVLASDGVSPSTLSVASSSVLRRAVGL